MKFELLKKIDDSLGTWICSILGLFLRLKKIILPPKNNQIPNEIHKIVCQKYFGIGSILHSLAFISALKEKYPSAKVTMITLYSHREVVQACNLVDEILVLRIDSIKVFLIDFVKIITALWKDKYDISFDFEFYSKFTLLVSFLSGASVRIGLHQRKIRPEGILTHNVYFNHYKHLGCTTYLWVEF